MSKVVWTWITVGLILFFSLFIKKFAWLFGLVIWMVSSWFYSLSYIWIKCSVLETFSYLVMVLWLFVVVVKVYKAFK